MLESCCSPCPKGARSCVQPGTTRVPFCPSPLLPGKPEPPTGNNSIQTRGEDEAGMGKEAPESRLWMAGDIDEPEIPGPGTEPWTDQLLFIKLMVRDKLVASRHCSEAL